MSSTRPIWLLIIVVGALSGASCDDHPLRDLCRRDLPGWQKELFSARIALNLELQGERAPASAENLSSQTARKEKWLDWAESGLKRAQSAADQVASLPGGIARSRIISDAATDFVSFHGYAQGMKRARMIEVLERLEQKRQQIAAEFCGL